ncbi:hypothetical protein AAFF_G00003450 [Aldrovandia affinis]|uniref:Uncharacterized protein n=1 Tax=Aldrovandia affinis TaxID=143900 RepID=A0AAD7TDD2_9TELE|nr:hypothetical protein AAFF_G00003450 [Aldrovandia affinis]
MIADFVYWLSGGTDQSISKLIKQYWQAMLEHTITTEQSFSVMYTPCDDNPTKESIEAIKELLKKRHPAFTQYLFTDPSGTHFLPHTTSWTGTPCQRYTLTLGFRRSEDGSFLDKLLTRNCPVFTGSRAPFAPPSAEDVERMSDSLERKILPVLDFLQCTKLAVGFSAGSGVVERLQRAEYLGQLRRTTEQSHVLQQALAELAVAPYLQDLSDSDSRLLQALMADSMDTLEGRQTDKERVWNEMQKVGLLEELLYEQEGIYLRDRVHLRGRTQKTDRKPRGRKRKTPLPTDPPSTERRSPRTDRSGNHGSTDIDTPQA